MEQKLMDFSAAKHQEVGLPLGILACKCLNKTKINLFRNNVGTLQ